MEFSAFSLIFIEQKDQIPRTKGLNGRLISLILIKNFFKLLDKKYEKICIKKRKINNV